MTADRGVIGVTNKYKSVKFDVSVIQISMQVEYTKLIHHGLWWNDNRWPHQKTSTLDDVIARNST